MNKKILLAIATILVLGLAVAGFAYKRTSGNGVATAVTCCDKDSCPMKANGEKADCDCCTGDSCPMMNGEKTAAHQTAGMPESCPMMMKKDAKTENAVAVSTTDKAGKKSCDCSCCKHAKEKKDTATAPAV